MNFATTPELELFAESVRGVAGAFQPQLEPAFGEADDDRDDELGTRLAGLGWAELWADEHLLGAAAAGGIELGAVFAPVHLVDEATLGAPLGVGDRVRHGLGRAEAALAVDGRGLELVRFETARAEPTLDATGTVRVGDLVGERLDAGAAAARWRAWSAATLAYLAGLARASLAASLDHARDREQFGAPLSALATMQQRLADAALAVDGLELLAWQAVAADGPAPPVPELRWAGRACRDVTASSQQVHGAIGFALETGVHVAYRRAKSVQAWTDAVCSATST